ncbi:hypothetical protein GDO86_004319 [Hymenochirus boettgeri]|uniref:Uncharacterized protein n=1 Tax=Hymenochirus boettgeri TaxID=247094 RepID=A0A8T2KD12_9PIPI|nr:hypothetical protein GDO86_004319 [Hymenochirus boettgeri]
MWLSLLVLLALIFLYRQYRHRHKLQNLTDKYVLITGCDSGFGYLAAKQMDNLGLHVLAACLTKKGAEELKNESSTRLQTVILDVTDCQSVTSVANWVSGIVGNKGLWGLVNNAGVSLPIAPTEWLSKDDYLKVLNVNLLGLIDVTIKLLPQVRKAKGRIVNVSSIAGRVTICPGGYCISKYGVESFSDNLRREMAPFGVKVCMVEPGFFRTQVTDARLLKENFKIIWERVPDEVRKSYGQQFYEKTCSITDLLQSKTNTKLHLVTDCMEHALTAVYPKTRYSAGWDAKLLYLPLSYLPTVIADLFFKMKQPKPAQSL